MTALDFLAVSESELADAVLAVLRAAPGVQAHVGDPARIHDGEAESPAYPFIVLERHETQDVSVSEVCGLDHRLQLAVYSRHGGLRESKAILGALRQALEDLPTVLAHQRIVLSIVTYCDTMRMRNPHIFRGLLRVRIQTEEL